MTKQDAVNEALEAYATGQAETAVIGQHSVYGWVWRDGEDVGGIAELRDVQEVFHDGIREEANRHVIWADGRPDQAIEGDALKFDSFAAAFKLGCDVDEVNTCRIGEMAHYGVTLR